MEFTTNQDIAKLLRKIEAAYILTGENRFKIAAYARAADVIENSTIELKDLWENDKINSLPGIGSAIGSYLDELFRTGEVVHFKQVLSKVPSSVYPLIDIPGFGPKRAYKLVKTLNLNNPKTVIDDLLNAAKNKKIAPIEGFGERSEKDIIQVITRYKKMQGKPSRMTLFKGYSISRDIVEYLNKNKATKEAIPLGSIRRMVATIGDIDIAVSTKEPKEVIEWFVKYNKVANVLEKGVSGASVLLNNGKQIDLRVQTPNKFGAMLQYFTGSKLHNIRLREYAQKLGFSLNEYGIKSLGKRNEKLHNFSREKDFYNFIKLDYIPPELREDTGEIEAAIKRSLPKLVEISDIKGDLHIHSDYDLNSSHDIGSSKIDEILGQASNLGYEYIGISDHNPSYTNHSEEEIMAIMKARKKYFEQVILSKRNTRVKIILKLEIDILSDGKLALPDKCFEYIDSAIVSVHSSFKQNREKMTKRIIDGLSHPKAKILAHPTGRLLNKREGYEVDWDKVFNFCYKNNKAIEINSYPDRLDLPDTLVKEAVKRNVKLVINTDSHDSTQMINMKFGVAVGRRGWATKGDILNTLSYNQFKKWLLN